MLRTTVYILSSTRSGAAVVESDLGWWCQHYVGNEKKGGKGRKGEERAERRETKVHW